MSEGRENKHCKVRLNEIFGCANIIGCLNIIVTFFVGGVVALLLNLRQEALQRELVRLSAETEMQVALANLNVESACIPVEGCEDGLKRPSISDSYNVDDGAIIVTNSGPASAQNVQIVLTLLDINHNWSSAISSIKDFQIKKYPPTVDATIRYKHADTPENGHQGDINAIDINITRMPPDGNARIQLLPAIPMQTHEVSTEVVILMHERDPQLQNELDTELGKHLLFDRFSIASFRVDIECDNCKGNENNLQFRISALDRWSYEFLDVSIQLPHTTDLPLGPIPLDPAIILGHESSLVDNRLLTLRYSTPEDLKHTPDNSRIILRPKRPGEADQAVSRLIDATNPPSK